jgi:hypothetical protein
VFAVNTWERQQHLLPVSHQVYLDTNRDGVDDYVVLNRDASGLGTISDGRQLAWVSEPQHRGRHCVLLRRALDQHRQHRAAICGEQIGMNAANLLATNVDMAVLAQDFYFGGPGDLVEGLTVTPLGERFYGEPSDVAGTPPITPTASRCTTSVRSRATRPELGLMLITNGDRGAGNRGGATKDTEALLFLAP